MSYTHQNIAHEMAKNNDYGAMLSAYVLSRNLAVLGGSLMTIALSGCSQAVLYNGGGGGWISPHSPAEPPRRLCCVVGLLKSDR